MPIEFIRKYVQDRDTKWDVALYSGDGEPWSHDGVSINMAVRSISPKGEGFVVGNRQVSTGTAESIALSPARRKDLGNDRKKTRKELDRPLLMLHVLETKEFENFAAFGVSFPATEDGSGQTVKLKINTVYYKDLLDQLGDEDAVQTNEQ
jgi:hypothetical protein